VEVNKKGNKLKRVGTTKIVLVIFTSLVSGGGMYLLWFYFSKKEFNPPLFNWKKGEKSTAIIRESLKFYKEEVLMSIENGELAVDGTYYFKNDSDRGIIVRFRYPFPVDKYNEYPHHIEVEGINFRGTEKDIYFFLNFNPLEKKTVNIHYRQKLKGKKATYIVKTTRLWNDPIEHAYFVIKVPDWFKNLSISFKPDSFRLKNGYIYCYITRRKFFPDKDLIVEWE
jgi:hypothetical protein